MTNEHLKKISEGPIAVLEGKDGLVYGNSQEMSRELLAIKERVAKVEELPKVHLDSTAPMDTYHTGMYNGLECAVACLTGREANYRRVENAPAKQTPEE